MRLLGLDFETTGFDTATERVTEIGAALWDVDTKRPLVTFGQFLIDDGIRTRMQNPEVSAMTERVCGITLPILEEFGMDPKKNFDWLGNFCVDHKVDYIVAHNGENYDRPLCISELARLGLCDSPLQSLPWLDTRSDIPFPSEPDSRKLKHLALDCGFINPFAHRAVFDVLTMLRVLSNYPLADVIAYSKIPFVTVRAMVSFDDRQLAKDQRFSWEKLGDKVYPKMWVKRVKANQMEQEVKNCAKFQIAQIE